MISFEPFPTLTSPRLVLRKLERSDLSVMFRNLSDPEVVRYFGRAPDSDIAQMEQRLETIEEGIRTGTSIRWGITLAETGELVGSVGFWKWNQPHFYAEIGYELSPSVWGRGVMVEALKPILRFGFDVMKLHRVEATIDPKNNASRRVLEKLGFIREAVLRENWFFDGEFGDTELYGLLAREGSLA